MNFVLSGNLLRFSNFQHEVQIEGPTIEGAIHNLIAQLPDLKPVLLDGAGNIRKIHRVFANGDLITADEMKREAGPQDEVHIVTAIAGG
jgi:hypothetical protein